MNTNDRQELGTFVNEHIVTFHQARLDALGKINLNNVLKKKNPYLFRAKNITVASDLVSAIMNAYLSSSEEAIFGGFLEELAIHVSQRACGGWKSTAPGLDLEFDREGKRYIVAIKSGPNWGNSSQYAKLRDNFQSARKVLGQSKSVGQVQPVLGICYGKSPFRDNGLYWKIAGQRFWYFLCGDRDLYKDLIEPIGFEAKRHNDDFEQSRGAILNNLTAEFIKRFCSSDGSIAWGELVAFNSGNLKENE